jgi:DNA uptake protein ComE-like DNA-binding protein
MMLREWAVIALVLGFLVSIVVIAKFSEVKDRDLIIAENGSKSPMHQMTLQVTLSGAVRKPGVYFCKPGSPLKELLKQAGLTPQAQKKKIDFKRIIYSSQSIEIPQKPGAEASPEM